MDVYGLIGLPLDHSFSKKYFLEKFRRENITRATFELFPLKQVSDFNQLLSSNQDLKGLAVTIPYKVTVIPFLSQLTAEASAIGAVNCIEILPGRTIGHNTDAIGFEKSLQPLLQPNHTGALVLGNGGASKAVTFVLEKLGIPYLIVSRANRAPRQINYADVDADLLKNYPVIINCTPVGTQPNLTDKPMLPYHLLSSDILLYDLIYNPEETAFLQEGRLKNCTIKNGLEMLHLQAEENWKIWNRI